MTTRSTPLVDDQHTLAERKARRKALIDKYAAEAVQKAAAAGRSMTCYQATVFELPLKSHITCVGPHMYGSGGFGCLCECHDPKAGDG